MKVNLLSESVVSRPSPGTGPCAVDWLSTVGPLSESDACRSDCSTWQRKGRNLYYFPFLVKVDERNVTF